MIPRSRRRSAASRQSQIQTRKRWRASPNGLNPVPPQRRPLAWWPSALMDVGFAPAWPRVAALACAAVLGISIGLSGVGTRIAADLDLVRIATADDVASNVFELDMGFRP